MRFPTFAQWKRLPQVLSRAEIIALLVCVITALACVWILLNSAYVSRTALVPSDIGSFTEGAIGTPRFLNPLYKDSSDIDRDVSSLIYSGLLTYGENGALMPDLAKSYSASDNGATYEFILKDNLFWSDGQKLTSDDILYTISIIQDPAYKSPLRGQWLGVSAEKITDTGLRLKLKTSYGSFLENCVLKILPKHIWENISADDFLLSSYNLNPIGSGPYLVKKVNKSKDKNNVVSLELAPNSRYYGDKPHIQKFVFAFFSDKESLTASFRRGNVKGFVWQEAGSAKQNAIAGATAYSFILPRYFALFFNSDANKALDDAQVRQALNFSVNKQEIISQVLDGAGTAVNSPILPDIYRFNNPTVAYNYDIGQAQQLLDKAGFIRGENGLRSKSINRKPAFQFNKNLTSGSRLDPDVKELQKCLAKEVAPDLEASGLFGAGTKDAVNKFQEKYRADILDPNGLAAPTGDVKQATREKLNAVCFPSGDQTLKLNFTITTVDQPVLIKVAQFLKAQWEAVGVEVDIKAVDIDALERDAIKPRNYEILLFGEVLGALPDPFPFWHSSQKSDPGLNFSLYQNKDADASLEGARKTIDSDKRAKLLESFQDILLKDAPAVFLYNPSYIYVALQETQGIKASIIADPAGRFFNVSQWYIQLKRVWR